MGEPQTKKSTLCQMNARLELCEGGFVTVTDEFALYVFTPGEHPENVRPELKFSIFDHRIHIRQELSRYPPGEWLPLGELRTMTYRAVMVPAWVAVVENIRGD